MAFQMGAWCRDLQPAGVINGVPGNHFETADSAGNTASKAFATPCKFIRAVVFIKGFTAGGTGGSMSVQLKVGTETTLVSSPAILDTRVCSQSSSYSFILQGFAPVNAVNFAKVEALLGTTGGSVTFDSIIDGL